jgi:hypothetical protein
MQQLSREDLYERVWAEPMIKVAAEFGVSGTALKKTCNRYGIPTPERGYWAKLAHGKRVTKDPLPKLKNGRGGEIQVHPTRAAACRRRSRTPATKRAPPSRRRHPHGRRKGRGRRSRRSSPQRARHSVKPSPTGRASSPPAVAAWSP